MVRSTKRTKQANAKRNNIEMLRLNHSMHTLLEFMQDKDKTMRDYTLSDLWADIQKKRQNFLDPKDKEKPYKEGETEYKGLEI